MTKAKHSQQLIHGKNTYMVLPMSSLIVDMHYQRDLNPAHLNKMIAGYRPDAPVVILVSAREDGSYAIVDGQHRKALLERMGETCVVCGIRYGLTVAQEAALFMVLNNTKRVKKLQSFRAQIQAEDAIAQTVNRVLVKNGWDIPYQTGKKKNGPRSVRAVQALYSSLEQHGEQAATKLKNHPPSEIQATAAQKASCDGDFCGFSLQKVISDVILDILETKTPTPRTKTTGNKRSSPSVN